MRVRRDDLYAQVWREAMTTVAKRFGVSSNYLARVCDSLNVPHPPRGYWARRAAGEKIRIPPLPAAEPGDAIEWSRDEGPAARVPFMEFTPPVPQASPRKATQKTTHHVLVTAWRAHLESASVTPLGYLKTQKYNVLDAFVTRDTVRTATVLLNSLFQELESRGYPVALAGGRHRPPLDVARRPFREDLDRMFADDRCSPGYPTVVTVAKIPIGLSLFELTESVRARRVGEGRYVRVDDLPRVQRYAPQIPGQEDSQRNVPTGRLVLRAYSPFSGTDWKQEWEEQAPGDLVPRVGEIVAALEAATAVVAEAADAEERRQVAQRKRWEEDRRASERKERARARAEAREKSIQELRAIAKAWAEAYALEPFFAEVRRRAEQMPADRCSLLLARIERARSLLGTEDAVQRFLKWREPKMSDDDQLG